MITIDINKLSMAVFNRLSIDSVGQPVRDLLARDLATNGAESVIITEYIMRGERPPRPFITVGEGLLLTRDRTIQVARFRLSVFDEIAQGSASINAIIPLISAAFDHLQNPLLADDMVVTNVSMDNVSRTFTDPVLNFVTRYLDLSMDCSGKR